MSEINLENVKIKIKEEFPEIKSIDMEFIDTSKIYKIIQTVLDGKISFRNIASGGTFGDLTEDDFLSYLIETIHVQLGLYKKLDRAQIIKDGQTIMYLDMADPKSFHKLTDSELRDKISEYDIKKDELKKKEELPIKKS